MGIQDIFPKTLFTVCGIPIKDTVVHTSIVVVILSGVAIWANGNHRAWDPPKWQLLLEYIIEYMENLIDSMGGRALPDVVSFLTTMILFIGISNVLGIVPVFQAPTRDLSTTIALSLVSLGATQYFGVKRRGTLKYLKSLASPVIMLPMNLLSMVSRSLSMALRLFGNIIAGEIIVAVFFMLLPVLGPLPMTLLSMLTSVLQALVFTVLTLVYIVEATGSMTDAPPESGGTVEA
ncbi:MAG: F0F1 ATP synthase subunit A [Chloroflexota bacterium]|nr:F0F1 ATP synthase subunit A [Chloroflexota bacterium]